MSDRDFVPPHRVQQGALLGAGGFGVVYEGVLESHGGAREQVGGMCHPSSISLHHFHVQNIQKHPLTHSHSVLSTPSH